MGRKAGITSTDIVEAATQIADREGLAAATPSAVASALGIKTPSLYHHIGGAAGLRRAIALRAASKLTEAIASSSRDDGAPDRLRAMARAYRAFAVEHPGLHAALLPAPTEEEDPELYRALAGPVTLVAREIETTTDDPDDVIHSIRAIRALLFGFVELETRRGFGMPYDVDVSFEHALDMILPPPPG